MSIQAHKRAAGFTLVELITVIVILGVLSGVALSRNGSPGAYTLKSQAQTMAANIRHVQSLATSWGKSLRITATAGTNGSYSVSCVTSGSSPCDASPVINPVTGLAYTVSLEKNVVLSGTASLDIDSLGKPSASASYGLAAGSATAAVSVAAVTGYVTVTP